MKKVEAIIKPFKLDEVKEFSIANHLGLSIETFTKIVNKPCDPFGKNWQEVTYEKG